MIKIISLWVFMGTFLACYSQTISIVDNSNGIALESVIISSKNPTLLVISDRKGNATISAFVTADSISIRMMGYNRLTTNYVELKKQNFKVRLTKSKILLDEVVVSCYKEETTEQTSLHIEPIRIKDIEQRGTFNLTDALTNIPGVNQFSSGIGITKPVIRGLYGNRILVLFSGLRFDNQQWQDEHGMGLSDVGVSKVEIIKGPLSILYGTEAIGGVINIIEEEAPKKGTSETMIKSTFHSNTMGESIELGRKVNYGKRWYRLRLGANNHSDYSDGNNNRVLNSRFNGYYLKSSFGFTKGNWKSDNHYNFSYNKFGFVFNDFENYMQIDKRWSRKMSGPHHIVLLNMFSSTNSIKLKQSELKFNAGVQSNLRSENEGGGELSLIMHLITGQYALKWSKQLKRNFSLVVSNNSSLENNTNYGKRKIVPDAWIAESALSIYLKHNVDKVIFEYGVGSGIRYINTLPTNTVNSLEKEIQPFKQVRPFSNGMLGISYNPRNNWNFKTNFSSGVRAPNLAELSANGLHEGIYTYEIGDPNMKNEQNINGDVGIYHTGSVLQFSLSGFYNYFNKYIYLNPTSGEWYGFPVYEYKQYDARIYGSEIEVSLTPNFIKGLKLAASYAELIGELSTGEYLPYMPAQKIKPEIRYSHAVTKDLSAYCFVNTHFVMQQSLVNSQEKITPSYQLVNSGAGMTLKTNNAEYVLNIAANNLLNEAYYDHLSRYKNFGLLNIGRDISINLKINFINNLKNNKNENNN